MSQVTYVDSYNGMPLWADRAECDEDGNNIKDTYAKLSDIPSDEGKADKVAGATSGDLAGLDASGNLVDSGIAASDVATQSDLSSKQDVLTAGTNITIDANNVISASGSTYTAGTGIDITSDVISVDTTVVATQTDLAGKQNALTAGSNITITGDTISATDTTYQAGSGIDITGTTISADTTVLATQQDLSSKQDALTAGSNITINNNVISATDTTYSAGTNVQINGTTISATDTTYTAGNGLSLSGTEFAADTTVLATQQDLSAKEDVANKAQTLDPTSSTEYPSSEATANFVNSSIATSTANFLGNYTLTELSLTYPATNAQIAAALDLHQWPVGVTPTNNDYVYVEIQNPQTTGIDDEVRRFKFNGATWLYEYTLNNSSFTAAEKDAIDSGINSTKVSTYDNHVSDTDIHVTVADKTAWNSKQDALTAGTNVQINGTTISATDTTYTAGSGLTLTGTEFSADTTVLATQTDLSSKQDTLTAGTNVQINNNVISATDTTYSAGTGIDITGTTISADTSVLATQTDLSSKQDELTAGSNITISNNTISATDTTYTAGTGLDLTGTEFSVDTTTIATKSDLNSKQDTLTAGSNITISNNTISATDTTYSAGTGISIASNAISVDNPLPSSTSADEGKVLKVDANGDPEWATGGGGSQVQSDWEEDDPLEPSFIENKPTPKTLVAGQGIAISESSASLTVTNTVARDAVNLVAGSGVTLTQSGSDLTVAVDTTVVATQSDLSSKQDTMSAGTGIVINQNAISVSVPISVVSALPASPDQNTLYIVTGA